MQGIALLIWMIFAMMADGIMEAAGLAGFIVIAVIVLAVTAAMVRADRYA